MPALATLHQRLWKLVYEDGGIEWDARRSVMEALRRAVLRENVLLRLLPDRSEREEHRWGALLVGEFLKPLPNQQREHG